MDQYLRRLKQELLSMREFGEGMQEQMTCMMGALQELKLLQLQTALEQLEISGEQNQHQRTRAGPYCEPVHESSEVRHQSSKHAEKPMAGGKSLDNSSLDDSHGSWMTSALRSVSMPGMNLGHQELSARPRETEIQPISSTVLHSVESQPIYESRDTKYVLQKHKDLIISHFDQEHCSNESTNEETNDWTSSLMSQSRNRQPLVLGDNIFADLVGKWLDLPEMEKKGDKNESLLNVSRSQEISKKFSLTANFFKKFLRSVRPDRDKLLKEKPGWLQPENQTSQIAKRSKKSAKQKSVFYFPSQTDIKRKVEYPGKCNVRSTTIINTCAKRVQQQEDSVYIGFDMDTAVWV